MNLSVLPDLRAAEHPLGAAVADDTTDLNNSQFLDAVRRAAAVLSGQGVAAGDVVALMLTRLWSAPVKASESIIMRHIASRLVWSSITPLGRPVVPLV